LATGSKDPATIKASPGGRSGNQTVLFCLAEFFFLVYWRLLELIFSFWVALRELLFCYWLTVLN
jgi:hypothetical protein